MDENARKEWVIFAYCLESTRYLIERAPLTMSNYRRWWPNG